ncbi:uncharacterized protein LOC112508942 [Cynara cardunculus var. scolymus]|uniref:uncharacterized protein LOC112508942 n=1 Tax=Cynara cardunculus var. scolymus TaxID=59895 RepID=UPI000D628BF4|nr:uncharacterized protein LOC112508942 [Cynara cardunculus var. scolymus]
MNQAPPMDDIFASPKQPSLFPMIISRPSISKDDYHLFYKHERRLFTLLLLVLHRDVFQSTLVMGFLIWLEREGYTSKNLVEMIINSLAPEVIDQLADEVVVCLKFLQKIPNNAMFDGSTDIRLLQNLLDRKDINLQELRRNQDPIFSEVSVITKDISAKAFDDILDGFTSRNRGPLVMRSPGRATVSDLRNVRGVAPIPSYNIRPYVRVHQNPAVAAGSSRDARVMQNYVMMHQQMVRVAGPTNRRGVVTPVMDLVPVYATGHGPYVLKEPDEEVPPEERTIFLTFSKGYPISENEVRHYFTRLFGDFIESIHMHDAGPENQSLYARIVARSLSMARGVIERDGVDGKSKYNINGKHVWARRFVKRTPSRNTNDTIAPLQLHKINHLT